MKLIDIISSLHIYLGECQSKMLLLHFYLIMLQFGISIKQINQNLYQDKLTFLKKTGNLYKSLWIGLKFAYTHIIFNEFSQFD